MTLQTNSIKIRGVADPALTKAQKLSSSSVNGWELMRIRIQHRSMVRLHQWPKKMNDRPLDPMLKQSKDAFDPKRQDVIILDGASVRVA